MLAVFLNHKKRLCYYTIKNHFPFVYSSSWYKALCKMAESKEANSDIKNESLNLETESILIYNLSGLNKLVDTAASCNDEDSIPLDPINENSESRKSEEMPKQNTNLDMESGIQKTDEVEEITSIPDPELTDQRDADPNSSEGNCNDHKIPSSNTNIIMDTNSGHFN